MRQIRIVGAALLALAAAACSDATAPKPGNLDLVVARQRWKSQDLHTYAFLLQRSCFGGNTHPLYVAVVRDSVRAVLDWQTGDALDPKLGLSVDGLFAFVEQLSDGQPRLLTVRYDGTKGYPAQIDYDGSENIADDELTYTASDVHPIFPQNAIVRGVR